MKVIYDGRYYTVVDQNDNYLLSYRDFPNTVNLKEHLMQILQAVCEYELDREVQ